MRFAIVFSLAASPAFAWTFSPDPICTIWHTAPSGEMVVNYDPSRPDPYVITVKVSVGEWRNTSPYQIRFDGPNGFAIATDRHRLTEDGRTVIASDQGFDNVLAGLELNLSASAVLGDRAVTVPLTDAAPAVQKFRDCTVQGLS